MSKISNVSIFAIIIFIALFFPTSVNATTITVSAGQSIQSAINSANPGDTIQIRAGTYTQSFSVSISGTDTSPIKIMGYPGERPVIDGQDTRSTGINISGDYIVVSNLKVTNHIGHDINIDRASHVTLDDLEVYVTGRAVFVQYSDNITIKNCYITTPTYIARQTDGIYSQVNKNNVYENNTIIIYNSHTAGHDDAIQMFMDDTMIVRGNYMAQVNNKDSNAQCLNAETMYGVSKFYNNVIHTGGAQSTAISFLGLPDNSTGAVEIVGNSIFGNRSYHEIWVTDTASPIVKNNLIYVTTGTELTLSGSKTGVSNNLITADPKFVSIVNNDFHLLSNSPAIDNGAILEAPYNTDKDGKPRPIGTKWDIGAYEYGSSTITPLPIFNIADIAPDIAPDGKVDIFDLNKIIEKFGQTGVVGWIKADIIKNGKVDIFDFNKVIDNFGR